MSDTPPPPPPYGADPNQPPNPYQPGQQVPYGMAQYPMGYAPVAPDHPQATTVLVLGLLGVTGVCGILCPVAWVMGNRVVREIDASNGALGGRTNANAGRICGMVGTILVGIALVVIVLALVILLVSGATTSSGY